MPNINCTLAGANFRPADDREILKSLEVGDELILETEPTNQYDANAVRVIYDSDGDETFIGYIPKTHSAVVAQAVNDGYDITVEIVAFESSLKPVLELEWDE